MFFFDEIEGPAQALAPYACRFVLDAIPAMRGDSLWLPEQGVPQPAVDGFEPLATARSFGEKLH